jgi:threonine aldolase
MQKEVSGCTSTARVSSMRWSKRAITRKKSAVFSTAYLFVWHRDSEHRSDRCSLAAVNFIAEARRVRKVMGGGMRQAGYLAAAGIYALDYHVDRLKEDHAHARVLAQALSELNYVGYIRPVQTNIVIFDLHPPCTPALFLDYLNRNGIAASAFGPQTIRFVTHLDVSREMIDKTVQILRNYH